MAEYDNLRSMGWSEVMIEDATEEYASILEQEAAMNPKTYNGTLFSGYSQSPITMFRDQGEIVWNDGHRNTVLSGYEMDFQVNETTIITGDGSTYLAIKTSDWQELRHSDT